MYVKSTPFAAVQVLIYSVVLHDVVLRPQQELQGVPNQSVENLLLLMQCYRNDGYIVKIHETIRKALEISDSAATKRL